MARRNGGRSPGRGDLIAALDIGTSKVACMIAEVGSGDQIRVLGVGRQASRGVRAGSVVDMEAAEVDILTAVHTAEKAADETIRELTVAMSGGKPSSRVVGVEISVSGHEVNDDDVRRVLQAGAMLDDPREVNGRGDGFAGGSGIEQNREVIHAIPIGYALDGHRGIMDPRGMFGDRLGVNLHVITSATAAVRNLHALLDRCNLDIGLLVVPPLASGLACLVEDEMDLGVTLVDMGGGSTSMAVFVNGRAVFVDSVPVGGNHVTNDLARGLSTPIAHAERVKSLHGSALASQADDRETIEIPLVGDREGETAEVPRSALTRIIQPRIEEILELVRQRLANSGMDRAAGNLIVLTGGGAQLQGVPELAGMMMEKQVRLARPRRAAPGAMEEHGQLMGLDDLGADPSLSVCAGLLRYTVSQHGEPPTSPGGMGLADPDSVVGRVGQWLRDHF